MRWTESGCTLSGSLRSWMTRRDKRRHHIPWRSRYGERLMTTSLVITAIGPDQPGIVEAISDAGRRCGASWAGSRMASLAGQFAGIVHFEVAESQVPALEEALRALESRGLRIAVARGKDVAP